MTGNSLTSPAQPKVPILDLNIQNSPLQQEILTAMGRVIEDSAFILGPAVQDFEKAFANYCGTSECVAVNTGTSALHLALSCLDIGPGDEVITVSMSFIATAWPILYLGAQPVFVDIDDKRFTLDPAQLEDAITPRTKAIVPVHLYGQCADMDLIMEIAGAHGIPVIEDAAQAAGALYKGCKAGSLGDLGCFSFYPSKNLGAFGDGGAVTTNSSEYAKRLRMLRDHAQSERYRHETIGYNYRMDSLTATVLNIKLPHLDDWIEGRRKVAAQYNEQLAECNFELPVAFSDGTHSYHLYVISDADRDKIHNYLQKKGIQSAIHYPTPIHLQPPFRNARAGSAGLTGTELLSRRCLSLPMYPELQESQVVAVIEAVRAAD